MRRPLLVAVALLLAPLGARAQQQAAAPAPAPAPAPAVEVQQIAVAGTAVRAGHVATEVHAPPEIVTAVITDFARYREFLPRITASRVVQRRHGQADVYLAASLLENLGTVWMRARFVVRRSAMGATVEAAAVDGNVQRFECHFEVEPVRGTDRTRLTFQVLAIPRLPLPSSMLTAQQARWAARGLTAMRERAERLAAEQAAAAGARRARPAAAVTAAAGASPPRR